MMSEYRNLHSDEIDRKLFSGFIRRQIVSKVWRNENGVLVIREEPFIDDWDDADYGILVSCLKNTILTGGLVFGAFLSGALKGFVSVEAILFGGRHKYLDLTSLHVSEDMRSMGIGSALFRVAKDWARAHGAKKLYISAHSAVETQAFYRKMGCVEAAVHNKAHMEAEPYDCQLECLV